MAEKAYFIKQESAYDHDEEREEEHFIVVEAVRLGQFYEKDKQGYEYPGYCWRLREVTRRHSYDQAMAYIEGLKAGAGVHGSEASIKHPTIPSSCNGPGKYPLAVNGGPLLFTAVNVEDPVLEGVQSAAAAQAKTLTMMRRIARWSAK